MSEEVVPNLITRFFDSLIECLPDGKVIHEHGVSTGVENVLLDPRFRPIRTQIQEGLGGQPFDATITSEDGHRYRVRGVPVEENGVTVRLHLAIESAPQPFSAVRRTRLESPEWEFLISNLRQGVWQVDGAGLIRYANPYLADWLEVSSDSLIGRPAKDFLRGDGNYPITEPTRYATTFVSANGLERRAIVAATPMVGSRGRPLGVMEIITDVTAEHAIQSRLVEEVQQMSRLANTDPLTGISNRRGFDETLRGMAEAGRPHAVVLCDLDHFKELNDERGHSAGDLALVTVSNALRGAVRETDTVARIGGDEFGIVLPETPRARAEEVVGRLRELSLEFPWEGARLPIRLSVGWSHSDDGSDPVGSADRSMYRQKRGRRTA